MKPKILKIDPHNIDRTKIAQAVEVIHNRGLVAFPTETVYGLGANALDPKAVAGIFEAKKRPLDDPLIVHIADIKDLERLAKRMPYQAERLSECFWPGPLTLILKKTDIVPDIVTTGLDSVAVRMPSNTIAREFILEAGVPLAAPSANIFGRPSPTTAKHVVDDLAGRIDLVLDGGSTEIGIESTIVELNDKEIVVLRPGGIDVELIKRVLPGTDVRIGSGSGGNAPGSYAKHYSPRAKVVIAEEGEGQVGKVISIAREAAHSGRKVGVIAVLEHAEDFREYNVKVLGPSQEAKICAARLFLVLREMDSDGMDVIIAEGIKEKGLGLAVMNRLRKAAG